MKCPYCKQEMPDDAWHKCAECKGVSLIKLSRQCGKSEAMTDWMEIYVENAKLRKRIAELEADKARVKEGIENALWIWKDMPFYYKVMRVFNEEEK